MFFRYPSSYFILRQVSLLTTLADAQVAIAYLADSVAQLKVESIKGAKAEQIRRQAYKASDDFVAAKAELVKEIKNLEVNPEENKERIIQLKKALAEADEATKRFKGLINVLSSNDQTIINSVTSGFLSRSLRELEASIGKTKKIVQEVHASLGTMGAEKASMVQINEIKVLQGKMHFYMIVFDPGKGPVQKEIKAGETIYIHGLPVTIVASVEDDMKTKFIKMKEAGTLPGGTYFNDTSDATDSHKFSYTNPSVGTTTWVSNEEYTWEPDNIGDNKKKILRYSQRNSDISTKAEKGDTVDIWTVVPAQGVGFYVTGRTISWKRISQLKNKETIGEEVPGNNVAKGYINFSVFP